MELAGGWAGFLAGEGVVGLLALPTEGASFTSSAGAGMGGGAIGGYAFGWMGDKIEDGYDVILALFQPKYSLNIALGSLISITPRLFLE